MERRSNRLEVREWKLIMRFASSVFIHNMETKIISVLRKIIFVLRY